MPLPSNYMVDGNPPMPLHLTNGRPPAEVQERVSRVADPEKAIRLWDAGYRSSVARWPVFLGCEAEHLNCTLHRN